LSCLPLLAVTAKPFFTAGARNKMVDKSGNPAQQASNHELLDMPALDAEGRHGGIVPRVHKALDLTFGAINGHSTEEFGAKIRRFLR
jgi:hypothetical protein